MVLPTEDPLSGIEFGGDHEEMQRIQSHRRALRDLRTNARGPNLETEEPTEGAAAQKKKEKGKGRNWQKDSAKDGHDG